MNAREKRKNRLTMAIDFGGSSTKVIGANREGKRVVLAMEPDTIELPRELLEEPVVGRLSIENRAWVNLNGRYHAVGGYARLLSVANAGLAALKVEAAPYKVAAALWVTRQKMNLPDDLRLSLCCVLPPGEYEGRERFRGRLEMALSSFETPTGRMTVELERFDCKPEGAGVFLNHVKLMGPVAKENAATVMLGYRNASALIFRKGGLVKAVSAGHGYASLLDGVVARTSGYDREGILEGVSRYLETGQDESLKALLLSDEPGYELEKLKKAIALAREKYTRELSRWMRETLPADTREVVLCGGTADLFRQKLYTLLEGKELYPHGGVELPDDIKALRMGNRFADIWIVWDAFNERGRVKEREGARV